MTKWGSRVVLVNPPSSIGKANYLAPPIGLLQVAAALEQSRPSLSIAVIDLALNLAEKTLDRGALLTQQCTELLLNENADTYAFSVQCFNLPIALVIAERIKRCRPACNIVLGGHHATLLADRLAREFSYIDSVVCGSGEDAISPELGWCSPAFHLGPELERYSRVSRVPTGLIEVSRGCPFRCSYCSIPDAFGRVVKHKPISLIIYELQVWITAGVRHIHFVDDILTVNRKYVLSLAAALFAYRDVLTWSAMTRADLVDAELLKELSNAGCRGILYGIDSGSSGTLSLIGKSARNYPTARDLARWHKDAGINPTYYFLIDVPGETFEDIVFTIVEAAKLSVLDPGSCRLNLVRIVPGTPLAEAIGDSVSLNLDSPYAETLLETIGNNCVEVWQLVRSHPSVFSTYYLGPSVLGAGGNFLSRFGSELLERIPLSLLALAKRPDFGATLSQFGCKFNSSSTIEDVLDEVATHLKGKPDFLTELLRFERWHSQQTDLEEILFSRVNYPTLVAAFLSGQPELEVNLTPEARPYRIAATTH